MSDAVHVKGFASLSKAFVSTMIYAIVGCCPLLIILPYLFKSYTYCVMTLVEERI